MKAVDVRLINEDLNLHQGDRNPLYAYKKSRWKRQGHPAVNLFAQDGF